MLASKAIGIVVKANDVQALQKDLQEDFVIKSTLLNRVAREAATNQKPPAAAAEEKKKRQKTPAAESTAICLLALEAWLSSLWAFIINDRRLWRTPGTSETGAPETEPKPKPKASRNLQLMD